VSLNTIYQACVVGITLRQNKILTRAMVTKPKYAWNMTSSDTDQVKDLHSRGDHIGVRAQLAPHKIIVSKQTFSPEATP
jgi:hypothetical protein